MFKNRPRLMGFLVGLVITIAGCVAFVLYLRNFALELQSLDSRFLKLSTLEPDPRIAHVDIDDSALDRVGRWPWSRDKTAALIRVLHELGAKMIAVDLLIDERETPVQEDPSLRDADVEGSAPVIGEIDALLVRQTDDELADAIRTAGNVYLSVQAPRPGALVMEAKRTEDLWAARRDVKVDEVLAALRLPNEAQTRERVGNTLNHLRVRDLLVGEFTLTEPDIAKRLGLAEVEIARVVAGAKTSAARQRVQSLLRANPGMTVQQVRREILGDKADARTRDATDVTEAFRYVRSLEAVLMRCSKAPPEAEGVLNRALAVEPPLFYFVEAAAGLGAVDFDSDEDGLVRSVPAIVEYDGRLIKHLGIAVACAMLGISDQHVHINADRTITLDDPAGGDPYVLPLDNRGQMLIHWTRHANEWRLNKDFPHVTAAKVWTICSARQAIDENRRAIGIHMVDVVETSSSGKSGDYKDNVLRRNLLLGGLHAAQLRRVDEVRIRGGETLTVQAARAEIDRLDKKIEEREASAASSVNRFYSELKDLRESDKTFKPDERDSAVLRAGDFLADTKPRLIAANDKLESEIKAAKAELEPLIRDKIVFLGYAATALGDIVATPIDSRTNGVMCHAHVLNTILSRRFIWRTPRPVEVVFVLFVGALISFITATTAPKRALALTVGIIGAYFAIAWFLYFQALDRWIVLAGPLIVFVSVWAFVTLFRQLTAERERRIFAANLQQYTSQAIAERLAADPEAAAAFKSVQSRDVTVLFTDLAHFTTISETQDAETIQYVLNTYLRRMSEVIWRRRGLINKFMGDGVMAFFNPSVDPQPDHARVAVEVTLDGFDEMEKIKVEEANGPYRDLFAKLGMRAGIATGICKNGDFGSELKADYTVIGDVVNLAARLEPANKVFGTQLICPAATRDRVVEWFEFRYLAELQVKGKTRTVPVYEVLGRKGAVDAAVLEYAARFEAAVALYRERKFDESIRAFMRILARKPDDLGAARYIDACEELKSFPPAEGWAGALELKEK